MISRDNDVALVTGSSRGIGRATALALAAAGYDIVVAARTVRGGERHEDMLTDSEGRSLAGSLEETAMAVRDLGRRARIQKFDLLERPSMDALVADTLNEWGQIDVLINNAMYQGPALTADFLDGPIEGLEKAFQGNVIAQVYLTRLVLRGMLEREKGTVINLTSAAGMTDPPLRLAEGGWSFAHGSTKAALHRMAGILQREYGDRGIRAFNLEPGLVRSESLIATLGAATELEKLGVKSAPVEVPAAVIRWICTTDEANELSGTNIHAQPFCKRHGLLPGWPETNG